MKSIFPILFFCIINLNLFGQYVWMKNYSFNLDNSINSIDTTSELGFFIAGSETGQSSGGNYFVAKLDSNGNEFWHTIGNKYDGLDSNNSAVSVINTDDGGCLVGGVLRTVNDLDLYFIRIDSLGQVVWEKNYGGIHDQQMGTIIKNGNSYLCSFVTIDSSVNSYLLKLNDQGDSIWTKNLTTGIGAFSSSFIKVVNGNFVLYGGVHDSINFNILYPAYSEMDTSGNILFTRIINDSMTFYPITINQTSDGGFLLSSFNYVNSISKISKTDSSGIIQWERAFINTNLCVSSVINNNDFSFSVGTFHNSIIVFNFDSIGNIISSDTIPIGMLQSQLFDNITDRDGNLIVCGYMYDSNMAHTPSIGIVLKINPSGINSVNDFIIPDNPQINIFPNPVNSYASNLTIESNVLIKEFSIIDLWGNIVFQEELKKSNSYSIFHINIKNKLAVGTYFIIIKSNCNIIYNKKIIVFN